MLTFAAADGSTVVLRPGFILGAKTAATDKGPMIGYSVIITGAGPMGPVKATPGEIAEAIDEAEAGPITAPTTPKPGAVSIFGGPRK
jgi:hypothetical protein